MYLFPVTYSYIRVQSSYVLVLTFVFYLTALTQFINTLLQPEDFQDADRPP